MQALELNTLQDELGRRQRALKEIDLKLAEQLARHAVLEQLYEGSSLQQSQNSSSLLNQSSISHTPSSAASVSSSFLKQQIRQVYSFMRDRNADKHMNDTRTRTHLIDPHTSPLKVQMPEQSPSYLHKTTTDHDAMSNYVHRQQAKMKKVQQEEEREREMVQFLKAKQKMRQQSLKQERLKIRQQLLKEQNNSRQNIPQHKISKPIAIHTTSQIQNDDTLKKERSRALSRLLQQVKRGQRQASRLMEQTRIASYH